MLVEHLVREKLAGAPERFWNDLRRGQFLQRERHIASFVEDLQEFHYICLAGCFIQRHADGRFVQHTQVDPIRLRNTRQVFGALIGVLHRERIEIHRMLYRMSKTFQARTQEARQTVHATSDFAQAIRSVITGVHRRHVGQQCLRGADVARSLVAPNVLLARLQRQPEGRPAARVFGHPYNAPGHLALVHIARGKERRVRAAVS